MTDALRFESEDGRTRTIGRLGIWAAAVGALALFTGIEIFEDGLSPHVIGAGMLESVALVVPVVVAMVLYRQVQRQRQDQRLLLAELRHARDAGTRWRLEKREILRGLGEAIDEQFRAWDLTEAEREVALLMLKGLNHREIAAARGTSERTVRQQAHAVYAKSGLSGRSALSAFFLEDLLLPVEQRG